MSNQVKSVKSDAKEKTIVEVKTKKGNLTIVKTKRSGIVAIQQG